MQMQMTNTQTGAGDVHKCLALNSQAKIQMGQNFEPSEARTAVFQELRHV